MIRFSIIICLISLLFLGCSSDKETIERPDISDISLDVQIERLEDQLFAAKSKGQVQDFLAENPRIADHFLSRASYPHDSVLVNRLFKLVNDPSLDTVYQESKKIFPNLRAIEKQFAEAFRYIRFYYPEFKAPRIATLITGFGSDLYVSNDLIVIGLDYYLGDSATYRPDHLPEYIQRRFQPSTIVPTSLLLFSNQFNQTELDDSSLLAEMIYYGKAYYFVDFVLPQVADSTLFGYSAQEIAGLNLNRRKVWAHFIENQLLYEKKSAIKTKYLDERPKTLEVADQAPGRIATWVGFDIVRAYMRHNKDVNLRQLMENPQARQVFEQANYRPQ